ncbi:putative ABC transport system ATP-binding protein [Dethiosulfatibacter aminovorans DSM 17477]|uniref:Putative ABC transport system ATP-binding protein n=1 Tax=Dethiosulfatibacter aminovorans DSM 17477 TaxID=1121476 RepID=A0A1M6KHI1_9FIRM|nr:ABC transporter ATP-binding protein [Dethiosulfatibacter aminovorans]SHJ58398.1 putative ABC transport system ATP-binding protein [Dethiosulfatibacter aminovorans DSM 17477]
MIDIRDVRKTYYMGDIELEVLKGVSIKVEKGEFVSIIGPSGSGKSTLMNILGCLDLPTKGEYYLDGKEISTYDENALANIRNEKIGFIFQKFNLLPKLNAFENVELPLIYRGVKLKERKSRVEEALNSVGLFDRMHHRPMELSGGQQQRVAIARALVGDPSVLLADEPTGNLDTKSGSEVLKIIDNLHNQEKTILVITHDIEVAERAWMQITIRDGLIQDRKVN